jgi:catechol 2,3-dioxygenase-like lactoylglutathione lyase family enzyme
MLELGVTVVITKLTHVTILVKDYDEALEFYVNKLGFSVVVDMKDEHGGRFLGLALKEGDIEIVLQKPSDIPYYTPEQAHRLEQSIGSIPWWIFKVDDCQQTFEELSGKGVKFENTPDRKPWGTSVNFEDLYGNKFMLLELSR